MPRYQRLGHIRKRKGVRLYEYTFNESLLRDGTTEVFVIKKPKKRKGAVIQNQEKEIESGPSRT